MQTWCCSPLILTRGCAASVAQDHCWWKQQFLSLPQRWIHLFVYLKAELWDQKLAIGSLILSDWWGHVAFAKNDLDFVDVARNVQNIPSYWQEMKCRSTNELQESSKLMNWWCCLDLQNSSKSINVGVYFNFYHIYSNSGSAVSMGNFFFYSDIYKVILMVSL